MSAKNNNDTKPVSEQIEELNTLLEWFEQDDLDVEEALKKFAEADALAVTIQARLSALENEVNVLKQRFNGE